MDIRRLTKVITILEGGLSDGRSLHKNMKNIDTNSVEAFGVFSYAFTHWGTRIRKVQVDSLDAFDLLMHTFVKDGKQIDKSSDLFLVNGAAYWAAIADVAHTLSLTAEHLSRECNKLSGYQLDMGELEDVFSQQTTWNEKHLNRKDTKST